MPDLEAFLTELDALDPVPAAIEVDADLLVRVELPTGVSSTARVVGRGRRVEVHVQRPEVLAGALGRAEVGRVAEVLDGGGITVDVRGPAGPVATLGAGTRSRVGAVLTGSRRVAVVPAAAVRLGWSRAPLRAALAAAGGAAAATVVLWTVRRVRGRS
ncbi:hypothetical protein [Pseudonocardia alni]|uniref:hypothetical protein n=1 Tax=Pseudonocardia alni TaxID=33907 RepID=UPI00332546ED